MRKAAIAVPTAALMTGAALLGPAVTTANAVEANGSAASIQTKKKAPSAPVSQRYVKQYKLKKGDLNAIAAAKKWAKGSKPRQVRNCESGGNYRINTGNGYYGAYQFSYGTWLGVGGGRYARTADNAPKWAQDHMAWRLWKKQGWGPWGCA